MFYREGAKAQCFANFPCVPWRHSAFAVKQIKKALNREGLFNKVQ